MCQQLATLAVWKIQISNHIFPSGSYRNRPFYCVGCLYHVLVVVACCNVIDAYVFIVSIYSIQMEQDSKIQTDGAR